MYFWCEACIKFLTERQRQAAVINCSCLFVVAVPWRLYNTVSFADMLSGRQCWCVMLETSVFTAYAGYHQQTGHILTSTIYPVCRLPPANRSHTDLHYLPRMPVTTSQLVTYWPPLFTPYAGYHQPTGHILTSTIYPVCRLPPANRSHTDLHNLPRMPVTTSQPVTYWPPLFTPYASYQQPSGQILTSIARRASDDYPGHGDGPSCVAERDVGGGHDGTQVPVQTVH